jgi:hypothetical protein
MMHEMGTQEYLLPSTQYQVPIMKFQVLSAKCFAPLPSTKYQVLYQALRSATEYSGSS